MSSGALKRTMDEASLSPARFEKKPGKQTVSQATCCEYNISGYVQLLYSVMWWWWLLLYRVFITDWVHYNSHQELKTIY